MLDAQLTAWRMRPVAVRSGRDALDALTAAAQSGSAYPLVLLDCHMPELDGFSVVTEMAKRPGLAGATIMMLGASGHDRDQARCRALGITAHLSKPIRPSDLLEAIWRTLDGKPAGPLPSSRTVRHEPGPARQLRVLVAEDNIVNQRVAVGLLTRRGHVVEVVGNGREALEAVMRGSFDVVLMDVQMPELDGFEATAAIRARERGTGRHLRIVAMTAHAMSGDSERCLRAGMDGYVSKPLNARVLCGVVEQADGAAGSAESEPSSILPLFQD